MSASTAVTERAALLKLHEWDELVFGGFYCMHCTPDDPYSLDDPIWWPCPPLREAGVTDDEARAIIRADRERYATEQETTRKADHRQADEWNHLHPVGTQVVAYPCTRECAEHKLTTRTRTPAWTLGHGEPVVSVEGYPGGIALTHIDVTSEEATS